MGIGVIVLGVAVFNNLIAATGNTVVGKALTGGFFVRNG